MNARPEHPSGSVAWKKTYVFEFNFERPGLHVGKSGLHLLHASITDLADELQGYVQSFNTRPAGLGGQWAHALGIFAQPVTNFFGNIESDKNSHGHISFRRIISSAWVVAHWRIRSRSPGKRR